MHIRGGAYEEKCKKKKLKQIVDISPQILQTYLNNNYNIIRAVAP